MCIRDRGKTKAELWKIRDAVHGRMECAGLLVKGNERVFPLDEGIDFLGYETYGADHVRLRKRIKQKFARKMHEVKSRKRRRELIASFYGMAKHADCHTSVSYTHLDVYKRQRWGFSPLRSVTSTRRAAAI